MTEETVSTDQGQTNDEKTGRPKPKKISALRGP